MENENRKENKHDIHAALDKLSSDCSYLDYLIQKKFYKPFWRILRIPIAIAGGIIAVLAFFGIPSYFDLLRFAGEAETANRKIQTVYKEYIHQDSLNLIREENSKYYAFHVGHSSKYRGTIIESFRDQGFRFRNVEVEDGLNQYLYEDKLARNNKAYNFIIQNKPKEKENNVIGVIYNDVPEYMINRVDSIFRDFYGEAEIEYFVDKRLPENGLLYYID